MGEEGMNLKESKERVYESVWREEKKERGDDVIILHSQKIKEVIKNLERRGSSEKQMVDTAIITCL